MRTHSSVRARPDAKMGRLHHHPDGWIYWAIAPVHWPKTLREDRATSGVRQARKHSANAKRRRRDRAVAQQHQGL